MRRLRGTTWLNFAVTLLLTAVISPVADATHSRGAEARDEPVPAASSVHLTTTLADAGTGVAGLQVLSKPTTLIARADTSPAMAQFANSASNGVFYDAPPVRDEPSPSAAASEQALYGIVEPGKWTALLSTALLVGFLFLRRAS